MTTKNNSKDIPKINQLELLGTPDFKELNDFCEKVIEPKDDEIWTEWTEKDALQFADQFIHYADDNDIDYDKIDFSGFTQEYFREKYPKFDDIVYEKLEQYSKKKMEDHRQNNLTIEYGKFKPFYEDTK